MVFKITRSWIDLLEPSKTYKKHSIFLATQGEIMEGKSYDDFLPPKYKKMIPINAYRTYLFKGFITNFHFYPLGSGG